MKLSVHLSETTIRRVRTFLTSCAKIGALLLGDGAADRRAVRPGRDRCEPCLQARSYSSRRRPPR